MMITMIWQITHIFLFLLVISLGEADINIHNPRGSNNRLNEDTRSRKNANRLFNSENNNRGGHNVGEEQMYYYAGSRLEIQWAVQHSCGDENNNCETILQYMCGENIRDGRMTNTIPPNRNSCRKGDCDTDARFGHHEDLQYFLNCHARSRNRGLFTADQEVRASARSTRQNGDGTRYGYECGEERDYYPYWGNSPWKDIAVFTNNLERCPYYQQESQNVKERYECVFPEEYWRNRKKRELILFNNKVECESSNVTINGVEYRGRWKEQPAHNIPPPECLKNQWSRDNHQGNTIGGEFSKYVWTVPDVDNQACVIRMRYNISTNDFDSWAVNSSDNGEQNPAEVWQRFNLTRKEARRRQYIFRGNPQVDVFDTTNSPGGGFRLQVNINSKQWGRTFQDRTHSFKIISRPEHLKKGVIHNLNVRGKRGNIVQVFPSTEYDFVPNKLFMNEHEFLHIQWTGSDSNPRNNDGNGKLGTDRHNIVEMIGKTFTDDFETSNQSLATNYPSPLSTIFGFDWKKVDNIAFLERCDGPDPLLSNKKAYFDLGPQKITKRGIHFYMSTRNNEFSKRDQKATVIVGEGGFNRKNKGMSYRGFVSETISGITCQKWSDNFPHQHIYKPEAFPLMNLEENWCRNPNKKRRPWCFTKDPKVRWQYCKISAYPRRGKRSIHVVDEGDLIPLPPNTDQDEPLRSEL